MPDTVSSPPPIASRTVALAAAAFAGVAVAATLALWAHYGSTVFFEIVVAGLQACF